MFNFNGTDSIGLGVVFDNLFTTKDETQQNKNNLLLGQYSINAQAGVSQAQIEASKQRDKMIMTIGVAFVVVMGLAVILRS